MDKITLKAQESRGNSWLFSTMSPAQRLHQFETTGVTNSVDTNFSSGQLSLEISSKFLGFARLVS